MLSIYDVVAEDSDIVIDNLACWKKGQEAFVVCVGLESLELFFRMP